MSGTADPDLAPLGDRLALLQSARVVSAIAILGVTALAGSSPSVLVPIAVAYVGLTAIVEGARRAARVRVLPLISTMLLLDGVLLALAVTVTGGANSPLLFLMFLDVLAVTLLASYRSGLKIALWCALLLFLGQAAVRAGVLDAPAAASDRDAALGAAAFLTVALAASAFSSVNERALRQSRAQLAGLVELDLELGRTRDPEVIGSALARYATGHLGFLNAGIVICCGDRWQRTLAVGDDVQGTSRCDAPVGAQSDAVRAGRAPALNRTLDPDDALATLLPDATNVVLVPLVADDECVGLAAGEWGERRRRIPAGVVDALAQAATHAAAAVRYGTMVEEIERLATRDPLTALANRRVFEDTLPREVARARRTDAPLSLVVLDVDHFKRVNDEHGHQAGDAVLRDIAAALAANTKGFDLVARLGGDEFAVLLPGCTASDAANVAERLRGSEVGTAHGHAVTLSAGYATLTDAMDTGDDLVAAADAGLYVAKRAGRSQVATVDDHPA